MAATSSARNGCSRRPSSSTATRRPACTTGTPITPRSPSGPPRRRAMFIVASDVRGEPTTCPCTAYTRTLSSRRTTSPSTASASSPRDTVVTSPTCGSTSRCARPTSAFVRSTAASSASRISSPSSPAASIRAASSHARAANPSPARVSRICPSDRHSVHPLCRTRASRGTFCALIPRSRRSVDTGPTTASPWETSQRGSDEEGGEKVTACILNRMVPPPRGWGQVRRREKQNRRQATGDRQQATGDRQQATSGRHSSPPPNATSSPRTEAATRHPSGG
jgi:hypothetical protein